MLFGGQAGAVHLGDDLRPLRDTSTAKGNLRFAPADTDREVRVQKVVVETRYICGSPVSWICLSCIATHREDNTFWSTEQRHEALRPAGHCPGDLPRFAPLEIGTGQVEGWGGRPAPSGGRTATCADRGGRGLREGFEILDQHMAGIAIGRPQMVSGPRRADAKGGAASANGRSRQ